MKLTEERAKAIVYDDDFEYETVDRIEDSDVYKCYRGVTTVVKDKKNNYFGIDWQEYVNHYGDGEDYFFDCELRPIAYVEVTKKEWVYQ